MKEKMKSNKKQISFFATEENIFELITTELGEQQFVKYDRSSQDLEIVDSFFDHEMEYIPPNNELVANGTLKLPVYPEEYGDKTVLFRKIKQFIHRYVDLPDGYLTISALYVMLSWVFDNFEVLPYLRVIGDFGTGKTRYLKTIGNICYKACFAGGATTVSPIFRIIDLYKGITLIFDEADFSFSGPESDMVKILNCGYTTGMPVLRTEGDSSKRMPTSFSVFGPKVLATRSRYSDLALESRCLSHVMGGKHRKDIPIHIPKEFEQDSIDLRNQLLAFRLQHYGKLMIDPSLQINNVDSRINQICLPILSMLNNDEINDEVRSFIQTLRDTIQSSKSEQEPAQIIQGIINLIMGKRPLKYQSVAIEINNLNQRDYPGWEISPAKIGRINSAIFNLRTRRVTGVTEIEPSRDNVSRIQELASQYGIGVDDVDLVDQYFGVAKAPPEDSLAQAAIESLF